eukprot:10425083-Lingulodinium_polyedra.AAC.1
MKRLERLQQPGDEGKMLAQCLTRTCDGYIVKTDGRQVKQLVRDLELEQAKAVPTPAVRYDAKIEKLQEQLLNDDAARQYKHCVGVLMWIALRRVDLQFATKEVAKGLATPTELDRVKLCRVVKYLRDRPESTLHFELTQLPKSLEVFVDADWAGDTQTRRSTSGGL